MGTLNIKAKVNGGSEIDVGSGSSIASTIGAISFGAGVAGASHFDLRNITVGTTGYGSSDLFAPVLNDLTEFDGVHGSGVSISAVSGVLSVDAASGDHYGWKDIGTQTDIWIRLDIRARTGDTNSDYLDIWEATSDASSDGSIIDGLYNGGGEWSMDGPGSSFGTGPSTGTYVTIDLYFSYTGGGGGGSPGIVFDHSEGRPGRLITVSGSNFTPSSALSATISWFNFLPSSHSGVVLISQDLTLSGDTTTDGSGNFVSKFHIPSNINPGNFYHIKFVDASSVEDTQDFSVAGETTVTSLGALPVDITDDIITIDVSGLEIGDAIVGCFESIGLYETNTYSDALQIEALGSNSSGAYYSHGHQFWGVYNGTDTEYTITFDDDFGVTYNPTGLSIACVAGAYRGAAFVDPTGYNRSFPPIGGISAHDFFYSIYLVPCTSTTHATVDSPYTIIQSSIGSAWTSNPSDDYHIGGVPASSPMYAQAFLAEAGTDFTSDQVPSWTNAGEGTFENAWTFRRLIYHAVFDPTEVDPATGHFAQITVSPNGEVSINSGSFKQVKIDPNGDVTFLDVDQTHYAHIEVGANGEVKFINPDA